MNVKFLTWYAEPSLKEGDFITFDHGEGSFGTGYIRGLVSQFPVTWIVEIANPKGTPFQDYPYSSFACLQSRIVDPKQLERRKPMAVFYDFVDPEPFYDGKKIRFDLYRGLGTKKTPEEGVIRGQATTFPVAWIVEVSPEVSKRLDTPWTCLLVPQSLILKEELDIPLPQIKKLGVKACMDFSVASNTEKTALFKLRDHVDRPRNPLR